jgi:hypothetical protein
MSAARTGVTHAIFVCALARLDATVARLADALDVHDWDGPADLPYLGLRNAISHSAGLELVAPLDDTSPLAEHLQVHGEGLFGVVFGVPDLATALARAARNGVPPATPADPIFDVLRLDAGAPVYANYTERFETFNEAILSQVHGTTVILAQIEQKGQIETKEPIRG